ncbi:hypothetical protein GCM10010412_013710 [Nonomuraea recticatena]|uniref:Uncharacterized protein n=1 Tax=Nonomuraea recticatena TaxID=46178 RepID=A0ABN3RCV5_9ACTN
MGGERPEGPSCGTSSVGDRRGDGSAPKSARPGKPSEAEPAAAREIAIAPSPERADGWPEETSTGGRLSADSEASPDHGEPYADLTPCGREIASESNLE